MIKAPRDAAAGLFLLALAVFAFWQSAELSAGTLGHIGPGLLPRALAGITALCGAIMLFQSFLAEGAKLERWTFRGPVCILGAAVAFGLTIRPLGLIVAAPIAILIASGADRATRWVETIVFGLLMTVFCIGLFRFGLNLPIPIVPWLIGY